MSKKVFLTLDEAILKMQAEGLITLKPEPPLPERELIEKAYTIGFLDGTGDRTSEALKKARKTFMFFEPPPDNYAVRIWYDRILEG